MRNIPPSAGYSLLLFAPLLVPMLLPVPCLGAQCILLASMQVADQSSVGPEGLNGFCAWAFGPLVAAAVMFASGLLGHRLAEGIGRRAFRQLAHWAMFSLFAFLPAWYAITIVTSIGASETSPVEFLTMTVWMALAVVVLGQPLILLWLSLVEGYWRRRSRGKAAPGEGPA